VRDIVGVCCVAADCEDRLCHVWEMRSHILVIRCCGQRGCGDAYVSDIAVFKATSEGGHLRRNALGSSTAGVRVDEARVRGDWKVCWRRR